MNYESLFPNPYRSGMKTKPSHKSNFTVVVLNWNAWKTTIRCLDSLTHSRQTHFDILVIDNGSTDQSAPRLRRYLARLKSAPSAKPGPIPFQYQFKDVITKGTFETIGRNTLMCCDSNYGFTGGCNAGIHFALEQKTKTLLLLNNDATMETPSVLLLKDVMKNSDSSIVGAQIADLKTKAITFSKRLWPQLLFKNILHQDRPSRADTENEYWRSDSITGCAMLIDSGLLKQRFIDEGYYLDPSFFMYCEDIDLCLYAKSVDKTCVVARDVVVLHETQKSPHGQLRALYYSYRNAIRLFRKWMPAPLYALYVIYRVLLLSLVYTRRFFREGFKMAPFLKIALTAHLDALRGKFGKWKNH